MRAVVRVFALVFIGGCTFSIEPRHGDNPVCVLLCFMGDRHQVQERAEPLLLEPEPIK